MHIAWIMVTILYFCCNAGIWLRICHETHKDEVSLSWGRIISLGVTILLCGLPLIVVVLVCFLCKDYFSCWLAKAKKILAHVKKVTANIHFIPLTEKKLYRIKVARALED